MYEIKFDEVGTHKHDFALEERRDMEDAVLFLWYAKYGVEPNALIKFMFPGAAGKV